MLLTRVRCKRTAYRSKTFTTLNAICAILGLLPEEVFAFERARTDCNKFNNQFSASVTISKPVDHARWSPSSISLASHEIRSLQSTTVALIPVIQIRGKRRPCVIGDRVVVAVMLVVHVYDDLCKPIQADRLLDDKFVTLATDAGDFSFTMKMSLSVHVRLESNTRVTHLEGRRTRY